MADWQNLRARILIKADDWFNNWRLLRLNRQIVRHSSLQADQQPVAFFNASTRLVGISLNSAFSHLTACGLQAAGVPVVYFACKAGMNRCVLGSVRDDPSQPPPCKPCMSQAKWLFANAPSIWFSYQKDETLAESLAELSIDELSQFEFDAIHHQQSRLGVEQTTDSNTIPLGQLVLPSLRWVLRRHDLRDDETTRIFFREFILSAYCLALEFDRFLQMVQPMAVVLFNGLMYPEATARWIAQQQGLRVITHEVGFHPFSAFFTEGEATAYPIDIPTDFELSPEQNSRLDAYLEQRFRGNFTMAGIRFWPQMESLDERFAQRMQQFRQVVPVFTNVVFDTSQTHANTVFEDMFAWLDEVLEIIRRHPDTFFVVRAHLDEMRPGKESHQSVKAWVTQNQLEDLPNALFVESNAYLSSYDLIQQAKFVMVYNSSIGLEAALLGVPVLCAGKARYTQVPTVYFPDSKKKFRQLAEDFLKSPGDIHIPPVFQENARRFLYYQLFRASLPFDEFLENSIRPGYVRLRPISWEQLSLNRSATMRTLVEGITQGSPFLLEKDRS